ncbi:MAG: hypothetical protein JNL01_06780 [Bdellovibrionales bacterium]|nr:hypothetical protein [Bdellovibrionales bacterium]
MTLPWANTLPLKKWSLGTEKQLMKPALVAATLLFFSTTAWAQKNAKEAQVLEAANRSNLPQLTDAESAQLFKDVAARMDGIQISIFRYIDCEGNAFKLSDVEPDRAKRLKLTGGKDLDLDFRGNKNRPLCKDYQPIVFKGDLDAKDLDLRILDPKKAIEQYTARMNQELKCRLEEMIKRRMQELKGDFILEADAKAKKKKGNGLFDDDSVLEMEIHGPFSSPALAVEGFNRSYGAEDAPLSDARLIIPHQKADIPVKIGRRGHGRGSCPVPLLKIEWKKDDPAVQGTLFDPLKDNDIKWVSHCKEAWGQKVILYEYLTQKWAEATGFPHLKSRLVMMTYIDSKTNQVWNKNYGIFLEPNKDLQKRYDKTMISDRTPGYETFFDYLANEKADPTRGIPMMLIEALALNRDYWIGIRKNTLILVDKMKKEEEKDFKDKAIYWSPIPYDMAMGYSKAIDHVPGDLTLIRTELEGVRDAKTVHWESGWSDSDLSKGNKGRWKEEFNKYGKEMLAQKKKMLEEVDKLPVNFGPGLKAHVEDFFKVLESMLK